MVEKTNHDGDFGDLGHDGLLEGGPLGGQVGWEEKGGKELFFGTISVVAAPFTIGGGIVAIAEESVVMGYGYIFAGGVGGLNGLDDMLTNTQRESFTQQLTSDPNWKANIGSFKKGATFFTLFAGGVQGWKMGVDGPTIVGVSNDGYSLLRPYIGQ